MTLSGTTSGWAFCRSLRERAGGYRDYPGHTLDRVRLIRRALSVGFSLPGLTTILKIRDQGGVPCHRVRSIAQAKLAQVKEKIRELAVMRKQLEQILGKWDAKLARARERGASKIAGDSGGRADAGPYASYVT